MAATDAARMITQDRLARVLHDASEHYFDECYHDTYSGGMNHGEPYATCELLAARVLEVLEYDESDRLS